MAKYEILIPFILHCETGLSPQYMHLPYEQMFEKAKLTGFANDPADSGGATMCGITIGTYTAYRTANRHLTTTVDDLRQITYAEWSQIYKLLFWNRWQADLIESQLVANALVDWLWTSGSYAITITQKLLHVKVDGVVGPKTLAAINGHPDPVALFEQIQQARLAYHERIVRRNPLKRKFLRGWQNRVNKLTQISQKSE